MLAKVIAHAETRERALAGLSIALQNFEIAGVTTNLSLLTRLLAEDAVVRNAVDTGYIERESKVLGQAPGQPSMAQIAGACAAILHGESEATRRDASDPYSPWACNDGWMLSGSRRRVFEFRDRGGIAHSATLVQSRSENSLEYHGESASFAFEAIPGHSSRYAVSLNAVRREVSAVLAADIVTIFDAGDALRLAIADPFAAEKADAELGSGPVAPMPGTIIALLAKPGEAREAGAPMLILEAMKMEHTLRFPARGQVTRYLCEAGDFVAEGTVLAEFEAADQPG
jgi:3-methylcrotonyl-CoA carboxylase alpha subunit